MRATVVVVKGCFDVKPEERNSDATWQTGVAADVAAYFAKCPPPARAHLLQLRSMAMDLAEEDPRIGPLLETLKWGEPSYLTSKTRAGTTLRLAFYKKRSNTIGVFFNCRTRLAGRIKELYPSHFNHDGNRGLLFDTRESLPAEDLKACLALILTYHVQKLF